MSSAFLSEANFAIKMAFCLEDKENFLIAHPFPISHQSRKVP